MPITWLPRRREQPQIADLGPIGIMREAFRQFWIHAVHFLLIQLTLILPVVAFFAAVQNKLLVYQLRAILPVPPSAHILHLPLSSHDRISFLYGVLVPQKFQPVVFWSLLATFAFQAAQGLSDSVVLLSVGFIYTGQKVSFFGVLRSAIPLLWMRLAVTTLYNVFISHSIVLLETTALLVLLRFQTGAGGIWMTILKVVIGGSFGLLDLCLGVVFGVALGVSVMEEAYGWAAFMKAMTLLEGKLRVAIWFHVVWSRTVPSVITFALNHRSAHLLQVEMSKGDYRSWSPTPLLDDYLNAVIFVTWTTLFWQLSSLCAGIQYVSFKAYHNESIADSRFFEERAKAGNNWTGGHRDNYGAAAGVSRSDASIETGSASGHTNSSVARP